MLILGGVLGALMAGLVLDVGSWGAQAPAEEDADDDDPAVAAGNAEAPMILPDSGDAPDDRGTEDEGAPPDGETGALPGQAVAQPIDGTDGWDALMGGSGHDLIRGGAGDDDLRGGLGDDTLEGGGGDDWLQGDAAYGPGGDDHLYGGAGDDLLAGQGGDDLLFGDEGDDTLFGGEGSDTLYGGAGDDILAGHDGDDLLVSTAGNDDLDGGRGDDVLIGHDGPETVWMNGGEGDDTLMPGAHDFASGNEGQDAFMLRQVAAGYPTIADFDAAEDQLVLHLDPETARTAQLALREDDDGTFLLELNGDPVGRFLSAGGLRVDDVRIVALGG